MNKRTYQVGKSTLTIEFGDITTSDADVLVSSIAIGTSWKRDSRSTIQAHPTRRHWNRNSAKCTSNTLRCWPK
jgi:hypothetical protein